MYIPSTTTRPGPSGDDGASATRVQHYGSGLVGVGVVAAVAVSFAPVLFGAADAFAAATALVFGLAGLWALVWIAVETAWSRRASRSG